MSFTFCKISPRSQSVLGSNEEDEVLKWITNCNKKEFSKKKKNSTLTKRYPEEVMKASSCVGKSSTCY